MSEKPITILMQMQNNRGYSADQVEERMRAGDMLAAIQEIVDAYGEDAEIVTQDVGQRYGANFGGFYTNQLFEVIEDAEHTCESYDGNPEPCAACEAQFS